MAGYAAQGNTASSSECPNCEGQGVPQTGPLVAFAAACGALPGDDCPNCEGRGVLDLDDRLDADLLDGLAAGMVDGLGSLLDEDDCR